MGTGGALAARPQPDHDHEPDLALSHQRNALPPEEGPGKRPHTRRDHRNDHAPGLLRRLAARHDGAEDRARGFRRGGPGYRPLSSKFDSHKSIEALASQAPGRRTRARTPTRHFST